MYLKNSVWWWRWWETE